MMLRPLRPKCLIPSPQLVRAIAPRPFATTTPALKKSLPPRPKPPPDSEIEEFYLKGSGPGGQKIVRSALMMVSTINPPRGSNPGADR